MRGQTAQEVFAPLARQELMSLWLAGINYAGDHDNRFPSDMEVLFQDKLYENLVPSALADFRNRTTYLGGGQIYDMDNDKTLFAKYTWPEVGEATISISGKTVAIVYGKDGKNKVKVYP